LSPRNWSSAERYMNVAKLETLVRDEDGERVVEVIRTAPRTGRPGDGVIYALPVSGAVHILTGRRGDDLLPAAAPRSS
jgi:nitrogen regulatory protein P-II 1